jgi:hypothetical protein
MKIEFLQPRFDGARFEEHTLPLDVAGDLAAYEVLVVELAKHLYLKDHSERKRVPKGFESAFHLHLERVDDGSARPMLALVIAGALALSGGSSDYFEKARDQITELIASADGLLPSGFPKTLLARFNQVGRSLQADESMEFPLPTGGKAILTPDRRKRLVLAGQNFYEDKIELSGTIEEANWKKEKPTFRLRLTDGKPIDVPMPEFFRQEAGEYGGRDRIQVTINGIGAFDARGLQKVLKVRSVEVQPDYKIAGQLDQISSLAVGWHDGGGVALDATKIAEVYEHLVGCYPEKLPLPTIVPTPDGNLLFEWKATSDPSLDVRLEDLTAEFHAFGNDGEDVEESFNLQSRDGWGKLFEFLDKHFAGEIE